MKRNKRRNPEFKARAVELLATGQPVQELAEYPACTTGMAPLSLDFKNNKNHPFR